MAVARLIEFTYFLGAQPYQLWGVSTSLRREGAGGEPTVPTCPEPWLKVPGRRE